MSIRKDRKFMESLEQAMMSSHEDALGIKSNKEIKFLVENFISYIDNYVSSLKDKND